MEQNYHPYSPYAAESAKLNLPPLESELETLPPWRFHFVLIVAKPLDR